ncbi:MAG TPA: maltose alpha-D-glucosyltransferase [Flavipsychrobacter sp.]|nr:maltose alpha-D-glucosyltransferase [Flavipsychrobacter sp.]
MKDNISINDNLHWYKDIIIYELHIKAFRDGNCDGIGDFEGLLGKLDYLQNLGITAIWLLPFYPSPLKDDGYDIADYYSINPAYGNIKQFKKFLKEAHKRNLKVITELVINHTSDQHPWFQRARKAPKGSNERDYYVWTDDPKKYKDARIIFQDFESSNWTWDTVAQQYYWHRFFHHQPDLNYDNKNVQAEIFKIIDYWCSLGVDGFRLDAVPYLFEREGTNCENLSETHAFLKSLRKHVDTYYPGTLLLAEANMWPEDAVHYFGDGDECQMNYHFPVMPRMFMALQMEDRYPIIDIFDQTPDIPDICQWAIFLRNHDELTLEMVTDEERDYMYKVYVKDPKARINLGIRHRLAPLMENNRRKIELLNYLLFSLPGTPVIYYGDEIGMGDNFYLGDRDGVRTPMQWSVDRNAGFSEANPQRLYLPAILDPLYHYESVNVEIENRNTSSLLWSMKRLISTRKKYKAFSRGKMKFVNIENPKVLAFTRTYEDEIMLVVVNLSRYSLPAELDMSEYKGYQPIEVFSNNAFPVIKANTPYLITLSSYECQWFLLKKTGHAINHDHKLYTLEVDNLKDIAEEASEDFTNVILPDYLMKMRWFGGKARTIHSIRIIDHALIPIEENETVILLVEITYKSGLPEIYQLPVSFANEKNATIIKENHPQAVISNIKKKNETGILYDALYSDSFRSTMIKLMGANHHIEVSDDEDIHFSSNKLLKNYIKENSNIKTKILSAEQSNSSIVYDNAFFLKIYRKVDRVTNPDLELTRYLTQVAKFKRTPAYIGSIEWKSSRDSMALGMMQELIGNNTDGWNYMLDRLNSYNEKILSNIKINTTAQNPSVPSGIDESIVAYDNLPANLKELLEAPVTERVQLLGIRTGEMHLAFATATDKKDFKPEEFSLHYQRSLFSSFQSLVRRAFQTLYKTLKTLPEHIVPEAEEVLELRDDILDKFRNIYSKKLDALKIRIHGDYHLGQTLFTGKDILIIDFEGEPLKSYSERRLKRSPLRDVAGMMRSFHYAAYGSLFLNNSIRNEDRETLIPYVEQWQHYMSAFYLHSYLNTIKKSMLVPEDRDDLNVLLKTYILEKAIYELNYELNNRPEWVIIPLRGIKAIMSKEQ